MKGHQYQFACDPGTDDVAVVQFACDPGTDDVAVVVLHRTEGGCWKVESASGPAEDVAAVVAAAMPAPKLPDVPAQDRPLGEQVLEWLRTHTREHFQLTAEQIRFLDAAYAGRTAAGRILEVSTAYEPERGVDNVVRAHLSDGTPPAVFRRYYADGLLHEVNQP